ncbi:aldehyde dehydrogenase family protein, partial [Xanthomonas perforans]
MTASQQETVMSYDTVNPANGQVEHTQQTLDAAAIEARLAASAKAFPAWAALPLAERGALLRRIGEELTKRREDLQRIMTAEMGKLRAEALAEVDKCAQACAYYAEHAADYLAPRDIPTEAQSSYVRYEPLGCVFAVMPWNF